MELTLLNFSKRMNSTKQPTAAQLAAGKKYSNLTLKDLTNIDNPVLKLAGASDNDYAYNYAYIHDWGRYYHIKSADLRHEDIYHANLELDDLATYKTQILNTSAYIVYSSTNYDRWIKDDRLPILLHGSNYDYSHSAITGAGGNALFVPSDDETVILTAISGDLGITNWVMSESDLDEIMSALSVNDSFFGTLSQQFGDAMGSIIQVRRLPIAISNFNVTQNSPMGLGKYLLLSDPSDVTSFINRNITDTKHIVATGNIALPVSYLDFRESEPYCQAKLSLPFVGCFSFPLSEIVPVGSLDWRLDIDVLTGIIQYTILPNNSNAPIATYNGTCGGVVPIATLQTANEVSIAGSLMNAALGAGVSVLSGNPAPAAIGGISAIANAFYNSNQASASVIGSYAGGRSEYALSRIKLSVEKFKTAIEPDNLTAFEGRPVCKVDTLTNYTGYVKTQGFSIDLPVNSDVIKSINSKLDAGIYIE